MIVPEDCKLTPAKSKWNNFTKSLIMNSGGFPDFICYFINDIAIELIGVECKVNGYLDKEEKEKCTWLLENRVFNRILIASKYKEKNKVKIRYTEWKSQ